MVRVRYSSTNRLRKGHKRTSDFFGIATTRDLTKVISSVWDEPKTRKDIHNETRIQGRRLEDALVWLTNHRVLEKKYSPHGAVKMWGINKNNRPQSNSLSFFDDEPSL